MVAEDSEAEAKGSGSIQWKKDTEKSEETEV